MYDLTVNIDSESTGINYIVPGIHENIKLGKTNDEYPIRYGLSKNNNEFIEFSFLNDEGQTFIHTEYMPTDEDVEKKNKKTANQIKRIRHIMTKVVDEDLIKFKVDTFKQFADKVIEIIGDNYKDKLFRVKIVYNDRNYTTFPNYVPFIEKMEVEKDKSRLSISGDDKVTKTQSDPIRKVTNPLEDLAVTEEPQESTQVTETTNDLNDLPF